MTVALRADRLPENLAELRRTVRSWLRAEEQGGGFVPEPDAWLSGIDPAFSKRLAGQGWVGMTLPPHYGGAGLSALDRFVVAEELLAAGAPVAAHWIADRQIAPSILRHGTEDQRRTYLPGIAAGERFFGLGMSEPDSGSDLASVRTRATETEDGWVLEGTKLWTSSAHVATDLVVLARSDREASRHAGLSQFIVNLPHPQVTIRPIVTIDGGHHFNEIVFSEAHLPPTALLGTRGDGWRQVTAELATERSGPERILSTMPLLRMWVSQAATLDDPAARLAAGRLLSRACSLRQLSIAVAQRLERGEEPAVEAALVKDLGTQFEGEVVEIVRRFLPLAPLPPGSGDRSQQLLHTAVLHTPAFTLRGGTNEVLRTIVARGLST